MTFFELFIWCIWDLMRPKKVLAMVLIAAVAPFGMVLTKVLSDDFNGNTAYELIIPLCVYQLSLVLLCLIHGCNTVSGEVSGKTIQYILTRPVSRIKVLMAKWLAASAVTSVVVIGSCFIAGLIALGTDLSQSNFSKDLIAIPVGCLVYSAVFTALSVLLTRPAIPAAFYVFAFESWVWATPGDFKKLSLMTYLRTLSDHQVPTSQDDISEFLRQLNDTPISITTSWNTILVVVILAMSIAAAFFSRGEYVPKEDSV